MNAYPEQQLLVAPAGPGAPPVFGLDHYVPIVKTLPGELQAFTRAGPGIRDRVTPLVEVANKRGESAEVSPTSPLSRIGSSLMDALGTDHFFFLDFNDALNAKVVARVLEDCASHALRFIPVVTPTAIKRLKLLAATGFANGVCLRVRLSDARPSGSTLTDQLEDIVDRLGLNTNSADLVLDMELIPQEPRFSVADLRRQIEELRDPSRWRNLVLLGTSIPSSLAGFPLDTITALVRHEWRFHRDLRRLDLPRQPTYGDYLVQAPPRPTIRQGARPFGNLRYTVGDSILIARGHNVTPRDYAQYRDLCLAIASHAAFRGKLFSWGDNQIAEFAAGGQPPLGQEHWRAVGTSHHIQEILETV